MFGLEERHSGYFYAVKGFGKVNEDNVEGFVELQRFLDELFQADDLLDSASSRLVGCL